MVSLPISILSNFSSTVPISSEIKAGAPNSWFMSKENLTCRLARGFVWSHGLGSHHPLSSTHSGFLRKPWHLGLVLWVSRNSYQSLMLCFSMPSPTADDPFQTKGPPHSLLALLVPLNSSTAFSMCSSYWQNFNRKWHGGVYEGGCLPVAQLFTKRQVL